MAKFCGVWKPSGEPAHALKFIKKKVSMSGLDGPPPGAPPPEMMQKMKDKVEFHISKEGNKMCLHIQVEGNVIGKKHSIEIGKETEMEPFPGVKEKVTVTVVDDKTLKVEEVNCATGKKGTITRKLIDDNTMQMNATLDGECFEMKMQRKC